MAIFCFHYWYVNSLRSDGSERSLHAVIAYITGERLVEQVYDKKIGISADVAVHDYTKKSGVVYTKIGCPKDSPSWVYDKQALTDQIKKADKRKNSRYLRTITVALHKELSLKENQKLLEKYLNKTFVDELGLLYIMSIHYDDLNNPHAHVGITTRQINKDGFSKNKLRLLDKKPFLESIRKGWEEHSNEAFMRKGLDTRISSESYENQGLFVDSTIHEGYIARNMEAKGGKSKRMEDNRNTMLKNFIGFQNTTDEFIRLIATKYKKFTNKEITNEFYNFATKVEKANKKYFAAIEVYELWEEINNKLLSSPLLIDAKEKDALGKEYYNSEKIDKTTKLRMIRILGEKAEETIKIIADKYDTFTKGDIIREITQKAQAIESKNKAIFKDVNLQEEIDKTLEKVLNNTLLIQIKKVNAQGAVYYESSLLTLPPKNETTSTGSSGNSSEENNDNNTLPSDIKDEEEMLVTEDNKEDVLAKINDRKIAFFNNEGIGQKLLNNPSLVLPEFGFINKGRKVESTIGYPIKEGQSSDNAGKVELFESKNGVIFIESHKERGKGNYNESRLDVIEYLRQKNNWSYKQVESFIAENLGVTYEGYKWSEEERAKFKSINIIPVNPEDKAKYLEERINREAFSYIQAKFKEGSEEIYEYLKSRGVDAERAIKHWDDTGWFNSRRDLVEHLKAKGFELEDINTHLKLRGMPPLDGILAKGFSPAQITKFKFAKDFEKEIVPMLKSLNIEEKKHVIYKDLFSVYKAGIAHKLVIAIKDINNKITGFTRRVTWREWTIEKYEGILKEFSANLLPKYKNILGLEKDELLVHLYKVKEGDKIVITEGYLDCISPNSYKQQFKDKNLTFIALGSANMNLKQAELIKKKNPSSVIIFLDNDKVGRASTESIVKTIMQADINNIQVAYQNRPFSYEGRTYYSKKDLPNDADKSKIKIIKDADELVNLLGAQQLETYVLNSKSTGNYFFSLIEKEIEKYLEKDELGNALKDRKGELMYSPDASIVKVKAQIEEYYRLLSEYKPNEAEIFINRVANVTANKYLYELDQVVTKLDIDFDKEINVNAFSETVPETQVTIENKETEVNIEQDIDNVIPFVKPEIKDETKEQSETQSTIEEAEAVTEAAPKEKTLEEILQEITAEITEELDGVFDGRDFDQILEKKYSNYTQDIRSHFARELSKDCFKIVPLEEKGNLMVHKSTLETLKDEQLIDLIQKRQNIAVFNLKKIIDKIRAEYTTKYSRNTKPIPNDKINTVNSLVTAIASQLSENLGVFTESEMERTINSVLASRKVEDDLKEMIRGAFYNLDEVVELPRVSLRGEKLYATRTYLNAEKELFEHSEQLKTISTIKFNEEVKKQIEQTGLNDEQRQAVELALFSPNHFIIPGNAGVGKTTLIKGYKAIVDKNSNYKIYGVSNNGQAAENLEKETGIKSVTIYNFLSKYAQFKLKENDILIIDEAATASVRDKRRIYEIARKAKAKIIEVGDANQNQSIGAGQVFDILAQNVPSFELTTIMRQRNHPWMCEASLNFAQGDFRNALISYKDHDSIISSKNNQTAKQQLAVDYVSDLLDGKIDYLESIALAYENSDVKDLNNYIRSQLKLAGKLREDKTFELFDSQEAKKPVAINLAVNDKILLVKNDYDTLDVRNGSIGTIVEILNDEIIVDIIGKGKKIIDTKKYAYITHAYACTSAKYQGGSIDSVYALATSGCDANTAYPMFTRHKERLKIYYGRQEFNIKEENKASNEINSLSAYLGRDNLKRNAATSNITHEELLAKDIGYALVFEYKNIIEAMDELFVKLSANNTYSLTSVNEEDIEKLMGLTAKRENLARNILENYKNCRRYLQEAKIISKARLKDFAKLEARDLYEDESKELALINNFKSTTELNKKVLIADSLIRKRVFNSNFYINTLNAETLKDIQDTALKLNDSKDLSKHYQGIFASLEVEDKYFGLLKFEDEKLRTKTIKLFDNISKDRNEYLSLVEAIKKHDEKFKAELVIKANLEKEIKILEHNKNPELTILESKKKLLSAAESVIKQLKENKKYHENVAKRLALKEKLGRFIFDMDYNQFKKIINAVNDYRFIFELAEKKIEANELKAILNEHKENINLVVPTYKNGDKKIIADFGNDLFGKYQEIKRYLDLFKEVEQINVKLAEYRDEITKEVLSTEEKGIIEGSISEYQKNLKNVEKEISSKDLKTQLKNILFIREMLPHVLDEKKLATID
ncbi:MAG: AAA family ATPase, partial [Sphingobacteriia bacterium]|nr:AAA family ATPase [Sphingobacteriia bacterium]